jgi:hypothetical protein
MYNLQPPVYRLCVYMYKIICVYAAAGYLCANAGVASYDYMNVVCMYVCKIKTQIC